MFFSRAKFLATLRPSPRKLKRLAVITPDIFVEAKTEDRCSGLPAPPIINIGLFMFVSILSKIVKSMPAAFPSLSIEFKIISPQFKEFKF